MTSAFARFQRRGENSQQQGKMRANAAERVGEILSDSNSELSSIDDNDNDDVPTTTRSRRSGDVANGGRSSRVPSSVSSSNGSESVGRESSNMRTKRDTSGGAKIRQLPTKALPTPSKHPSRARSARGMKKIGSRKWYSDSENEDDDDDGHGGDAEVAAAVDPKKENAREAGREEDDEEQEVEIHNIDDDDSDLEKFISGSMVERRDSARSSDAPPAEKADKLGSLSVSKSSRKLKKLGGQVASPTTSDTTARTLGRQAQVLSPQSDSSDVLRGLDPSAKKKTGFQKLVAKTFSPFGSRRKSTEQPAMEDDGGMGRKPNVVTSPLSDASTSTAGGGGDRKKSTDTATSRKASRESLPSSGEQQSNSGKRRSTTTEMVSPRVNGMSRSSSVNAASIPEASVSGPLINRRMSRLKQSPNGSEFGSVPRSLDSPQGAAVRRAYEAATGSGGGGAMSGGEALSPGQRKLPGAFVGSPGSGVVLEGWLRQKQRRGMKGMKKWNTRYFVLYAKTNEVRYYADVVQSAWGPIPLGEIGSISLRLIQRIGKPSHPKYRGCRFDITCRNSWGTHYADDYVSSEDENNNNNTDEVKQERTSTPRSSRVYSLMADSPQTTMTWVNTLDSLLVRSANSPRPDMAPNSTGAAAAGSSSGSNKLKRVPSSKVIARRRSSALETETMVLVGAGGNVPKPVSLAIDYIFDSTPGIETELFYQKEPEQAQLKVCERLLSLIESACITQYLILSFAISCISIDLLVKSPVSKPVFDQRVVSKAHDRRARRSAGSDYSGRRRESVAQPAGPATDSFRDVRGFPLAGSRRKSVPIRSQARSQGAHRGAAATQLVRHPIYCIAVYSRRAYWHSFLF